MPREPKNGAVGFLLECADIFFDKRATRSAAAFAYFMTLSVFPLALCVNAFVAAAEYNQQEVMLVLAPFIPADTLSLVTDYLAYISGRQSPMLAIAGLFTLVSASSGAFRSLARSIEDIYEHPRFHGIWGYLAGFFFSIVFLLVIYIGIVLIVTGEWFIALLDRVLGIGGLIWSWSWLRFLLLLGLLFCAINAVYRIATPKPEAPSRLITLPGAAAAAAALCAVSVLFSFFIGLSSRYSLVYGSLASLVIMMFWLYIIGNIIIAGCAVNRAVALRRERNGQG